MASSTLLTRVVTPVLYKLLPPDLEAAADASVAAAVPIPARPQPA